MRPLRCAVFVLIGLVVAGLTMAAPSAPTEVRIVTEGNFLPWNYTEPNGRLGGFEISLANDLCRRMRVKCTISAQSFNSMIPALQAGKFDAIMDEMIITPEREKVIAFSVPYASTCYTFAALRDSRIARTVAASERVVSLNDVPASAGAVAPLRTALKGATIGTLAAGTSVGFIDTYLGDVVSVRQYNSPEARDLDLVAGRVDAVLAAKDSLTSPATKWRRERMTPVGPCFQGGVVGNGPGVGLRKQDTALKGMFDKAIEEAKKDGTIRRLSVPVFGMDMTPQ